jgi:hypothetical protein
MYPVNVSCKIIWVRCALPARSLISFCMQRLINTCMHTRTAPRQETSASWLPMRVRARDMSHWRIQCGLQEGLATSSGRCERRAWANSPAIFGTLGFGIDMRLKNFPENGIGMQVKVCERGGG